MTAPQKQYKRLFAGATLMLTGAELLQLNGMIVILGMVALGFGFLVFLIGYLPGVETNRST